jgi:hypothetical protein
MPAVQEADEESAPHVKRMPVPPPAPARAPKALPRAELPVVGSSGKHAWRGADATASVGYSLSGTMPFGYHEPPAAAPLSKRKTAQSKPKAFPDTVCYGIDTHASPTAVQRVRAAVEARLRQFKALEPSRSVENTRATERILDQPFARTIRRMGIRIKP